MPAVRLRGHESVKAALGVNSRNQVVLRLITFGLAAFLLFAGNATVFGDESQSTAVARITYFGEIGCAHCDEFAEKILPRAIQKTGVKVEAEYSDILSAEGYERCGKELDALGMTFTIFPVLIIGKNAYQGNRAVESNLEAELSYFGIHGTYRQKIIQEKVKVNPTSTYTGNADFGARFSIIPVLFAGLIDGINPCAFATMLFFISWIHLRGGGRKRIVLTGSAFIAGVFCAYLAIGFGFFSFIRTATDASPIRIAIRYIFAFASITLAFFSLRDAYLLRKGVSTSRLALRLPNGAKALIHRIIRDNPGQQMIFPPFVCASFAVTGALVALLELACTGQIYFPTIAYMVQSGNDAEPIALLIAYNISFIVPLATLLVLASIGVAQEKVRDWFTRNLVCGKIMIGILFFSLGVLIYVNP